MEVIVSRGCGLNVHQATVVACLLTGEPGALPRKQVKTFSAMTGALIEMRDRLKTAGCTAVAMEATGVYWKPVYNLLEGHFDLVVANARHIKAVPGRKTDVKDAEWIADLLRHGLLRPSYVPPPELRELRALLRYRVKLVNARSGERNRVTKLLESCNIKLSSVASDIFGLSGRLMLVALKRGQATPEEMAELAKGRMRSKLPLLKLALDGRLETHHRQLLSMQLNRGMAWFYRQYAKELSGGDATAYEQAEARARRERRGLWTDASPSARPECRDCRSAIAPIEEASADSSEGDLIRRAGPATHIARMRSPSVCKFCDTLKMAAAHLRSHRIHGRHTNKLHRARPGAHLPRRSPRSSDSRICAHSSSPWTHPGWPNPLEETEKNRGRCESDTSVSLMAVVRTGGRCG
jgi:hypothetical protein